MALLPYTTLFRSQEGNGGEEVIVEVDEQVDVVEVLLAREAVGEVVARIDGGAHFAATRADEAEVAFAHFGWGPVAAQSGDRHGHGQVVANAAQQVRGDHGLLRVGNGQKSTRSDSFCQ